MADTAGDGQKRTAKEAATVGAGAPDPEAIRAEIELRAYYRYCERGCAPGADVNDWLAAEQEVVALHATPIPSGKASADDRGDRRQSRR